MADLKREAESSWASERVDNGLFRERINDVAAEVARLTAALEGPDSPIDAMLAAQRSISVFPGPANGSPPIAMGRGEAGPAEVAQPGQRRTLADRIRALQSRRLARRFDELIRHRGRRIALDPRKTEHSPSYFLPGARLTPHRAAP